MMDLRTNQEMMGVQDRYSSIYGSHLLLNVTGTFEETDIKGNNNLLNFPKTEPNVDHDHDHDHDPGSLFEVKCSNKKKLEVDNSLFSYSSFKKAMDLRTHNRTLEGGKRSIFEDAEYFSKNYCYKLLPITFEQVDESIIQSEHNYSLFSLTSESEPEEDCSRTMDYSQIKEKNYKRRRTKFLKGEDSDREELIEGEITDGTRSPPILPDRGEGVSGTHEHPNVSPRVEPERSISVQPLDLSAGPLVQDEKTDPPLRERPNSISESMKVVQLDSDKENLNSELNGILVTITRPDEKENYQPCDLFLNDIARLVPWLIDKDCFEVDILDRTCDGQDEFRKHRLYYVISESTWRMFQRTNERVILTNDQSIGQPLRKAEKVEKPSYLVFDQFSLAKCLAEYCQEIGGCFEYTCVEDGKEEDCSDDKEAKETGGDSASVKQFEKEAETTEEGKNVVVTEDEGVTGKSNEMEAKDETSHTSEKEPQKISESAQEKIKGEDTEVVPEPDGTLSSEFAHPEQSKGTPDKIEILAPGSEEKVLPVNDTGQIMRRQSGSLQAGEEKEMEKETKGVKSRTKSPLQPKMKNRVTTRSKSTSESETSQKSDKRMSRKGKRKRGGSALRKTEPPNKVRKSAAPEDPCRRTRSGKILDVPKAFKPALRKRENSKEKQRSKEAGKRCGAAPGRSLRPRTVPQEQVRRRAASKGGKR